MTDKKLLIAITPFEKETFLPPYLFDKIIALFGEVKEVDPFSFDADSWKQELLDYKPDVLVGCWKTPKIPDEIIGEDFPMKYACYLAGSIRKFCSKEPIEKGLIVTNWGNVISRTVAECGLLLILSCMRDASHWTISIHRENGWKDYQSTTTQSLYERRVGLHGFGSISRDLVKLLRPFDVAISTFSPSVPDSLLEEYGVKRADTLEDLFSNNDVIVELAALTPKTRGMVTEELLRMIPEGGSFVNIGRGAVVDEEALARVAAEGKLKVALDVYGEEPPNPEHPFRKNDDIMTLPHLGGPTTDRRQDSGRLAVANLENYLAGKLDDMTAVIEAEWYDRMT